MPSAFVFDAYGTLFDVHAAIARRYFRETRVIEWSV